MTKTYKKIKCLKRKYLKTSKNRGVGIFPPNSKKAIKKEIKGKESYIFIVYILFNIN